jgi:hypothetical protein
MNGAAEYVTFICSLGPSWIVQGEALLATAASGPPFLSYDIALTAPPHT